LTIPPPNSPQYIEQLKVLPLIHASVFCTIATRIQDRLVETPLLSPSETATYDAQLLKWYDELPSILSNLDEPCPDFLRRIRLVMKWRFQNIRIILHRPFLLTTALRGCAWSNMSAEEKVAVGKCRILALKTIEDISQECMPDLLSGWNAVWFCFQACMVPLVSLFSDASMPEEVRKWKAAIDTALQFFESAQDYSIAAKRSSDAVIKIYQAYKTYGPPAAQTATPVPMAPHHYQAHAPYPVNTMAASEMQLNAQMHLGQGRNPYHYNPATPTWATANINDPTILNHFWDDMMWDTNLPDMLEAPFGLSNDYEYGGTAQDSGNGGACWMHGN
jgi:hypothetical protein